MLVKKKKSTYIRVITKSFPSAVLELMEKKMLVS